MIMLRVDMVLSGLVIFKSQMFSLQMLDRALHEAPASRTYRLHFVEVARQEPDVLGHLERC